MQSCFDGNKLLDPKADTMIFLADSENLVLSEENYAEGNINSGDPTLEVCNGISSVDLKQNMLICEEFTETLCKLETIAPTPAPIGSASASPSTSPSSSPVVTTASPSSSPVATTVLCSDGTTIGYDDWNAVAQDIEDDAFQGPGVGGTFVLCPNTSFDTTSIDGFFNEALVIYHSNVIIQCGSTGSSENNCIVNGNATAIEVQGVASIGGTVVPTGVEIRGLSFVGDAERGAPKVALNSMVGSSQVKVVDCIFSVRKFIVSLLAFVKSEIHYLFFLSGR